MYYICNMKRCLLLLAAILLFSPLLAQEVLEESIFSKAAGTNSQLFRGKVVNRYAFRYNGTYFWSPSGFEKGDVMYNGKLYRDVSLNIDAYVHELAARIDETTSSIYLDRSQVAWFTKGGDRFVNLRYLGVEQAPEGFFQLIHDGPAPVFLRIDKEFQSSPGEKDGEIIGYHDPDYDPDVITYFSQLKRFYILKDGELIRLRRMRDLTGLYKDRKKEIRRFISKNALGGRDYPLERLFPQIMAFLDGDGRPAGWFAQYTDRWQEGGGEGFVPSVSGQVIREDSQRKDLAAGFFNPETEEISYGSESDQQVTYQNKVYEIGVPVDGKDAPRGKVTGRVTDSQDGLPIPGTVIWDEKTSTYVRSDKDGRYSISLPAGENILHFSEYTKEDLHLRIIVHGNGGLDVVMPEKITTLRSAIVSAESMASHRTTKMGLERVSMKTISKIPSAFGEGDVLKAVLTLPGVKSVGEASSGFNVRGGASDQNLILFNDNTIYNPSHMFGIFSSFNPDIVDNMELYKSSIPAEYGGRISSVLNIRSKEGSMEKVKGSLGIGLLTSRFHLEGPLAKGKTSFIMGGRTTYSDWLLRQMPKTSGYANGSASFSDVNLGVTHRFTEDDILQASGYWATDRFAFSNDTTFRYRNLNASLRYTHKTEKGGALTVSTGYDHFYNCLEDGDRLIGYTLETYIRQAFLKAGWTRVFGNHTVGAGASAVGYGLSGGDLKPYVFDNEVEDADGTVHREKGITSVEAASLATEYAIEPAVYLSDTWVLSDVFSLDAGIRFSGFLTQSPSHFYGGPEFRLSGKYTPVENFTVKAGVNTMKQYIHLISNTSSISPMDTWKLSDARIRPTDGWQGAGGVYWTVFDSTVDLSLEGYWKRMYRYLDYKSGARLSMNPNLADDLVETTGKAYGVEFMAKKTVGRLNGWISYSYSRTFLREDGDRGVAAINGGAWYNAPYDKPHDLKLALNYALTHRYSISVNVDYSTGRPVTVPVGQYFYQGGLRLAYSARNSYRIPDYFRLDAAVNIDPGHYLKALAHTSITIGVYNVTGRKNPYSVYFTTNHGNQIRGYMLSVFATQIPYINLNILF